MNPQALVATNPSAPEARNASLTSRCVGRRPGVRSRQCRHEAPIHAGIMPQAASTSGSAATRANYGEPQPALGGI